MYNKHNENAVSPVIGVILMVGITVILAATIAAFVFGMAGNMNNQMNKIVAVSVHQPNADQITVTYLGGQDNQAFDHATVNVTKDDGSFADGVNLTGPVGNYVVAEAEGELSGSNHVMVVGHFTDGSAQVLLDTYV